MSKISTAFKPDIFNTTSRNACQDSGSLNHRVLQSVADPEALLVAMIDTPGVAVLVHRNYQLLFANDTFAEILRLDKSDVATFDLGKLVFESRQLVDDAFVVIDKHEAVAKRIEGIYESRLRRADGTLFWSQMNIRNVVWDGEPARLNIFSNLEPRIGIQEKLIAVQAELEKANQAKSEFLAHMSHELRTPLNAVIGFSDLMSRNPTANLDQDQIENLGYISQSGRHLLSLINDVLDISKIEAGKLELNEEVFNLGDELRRGLLFVREQARDADLRIIEGDLNDCPDILGDRRIVLQMIINLLTNAIKYNIENGEVWLEGGTNDTGQPWFSISDTGVGIAEEDIEAVLSPYGRTNSDEATEGTGLGLPLVVRMAELHDAKLALTSTPGEGTTVKVTFPATRLATNQ
jgi:signal transduction histidine kinase